MRAAAEIKTFRLNSYLTDGRDLFQIIDQVPGQAVLLENVSGGELLWQALEDLVNPSLRPIVPSADLP
jgi:hypothetical protein